MTPSDGSPGNLPALDVRLFGSFALLRDGQPAPPLRTRKGAALLALLVLRAGQGVDRSWLAGQLWPDSEEPQARYNFRRCLSDLRRAFGPEAHRLHSGDHSQTVVLDIEGATIDVLAFDAAVARGDLPSLATAAALYRGPLLEGCVDEWVFPERRTREQALVEALDRLGRDAADKEDWSSAERHLRRAVEIDPLREDTQRHLMRALRGAGAPASALQCFRELRGLLARELRTEPAPETVALFRQIRADVRSEGGPRRRHAWSPAPPPGSNLPRPRTSFLGREREIGELTAHLQQVRLLTLIGAGGVGKTRLAIRVAEGMAGDFDDDVWFVDLAPHGDATQAIGAVAAVLGVGEEPRRPLLDTLCASISTRRLLLILDNCEHLVSACAVLVDTFLTRCPHLHVLVTSRQALGVMGEVTWRVPSLTLPDPRRWPTDAGGGTDRILESEAVRLFVLRAMECASNFRMSSGAAQAVAEVCTRLDGIPLAIELAAVRTRVLSVEEIARRLLDRFALLTEGNRTAITRHQTLRATLDWSYGLLEATQQSFLRRLSCFSGGTTLEAAEAICSGGGIAREDVLDLITALVDRSLVVAQRAIGVESRYELLDTIRAYGRSLATQSGEAEDMARRHASFFLDLVVASEPHLSGPEQARWIARLEAESPNLRAALTFLIERDPPQALVMAVASAQYWEARGYYAEGRGWLQAAFAGCPHGAPPLRARALAGAGRLAFFQADFQNGRSLLEQGLALLDGTGDRRTAISMLGTLGQLAMGAGDYVRAREVCELAVAEARQLDDARLLASQLQDLEMVAGALLDFARAKAVNEEALGLWRRLGDQRAIGRALMGLGMAHFFSGDIANAGRCYAEGLAVSRAVEDSWLTCANLLGLGHVAKARGQMREAHRAYAESLTLDRMSDSKWTVHVLEAMASLAVAEGHAARAAELFGVSEAIRESLGFPLFPFLQVEHDTGVAQTRASMDEDAFVAAWARGRSLSIDQAAALAVSRQEADA